MNAHRILVVEDDPLTATMLETNFKFEGYDVTLVSNGRVAIDLLASGSYDLILLDYMLPEVDGQTILRELRKSDAYTPVMMLTARAETPLKVSAFAAGADDYLSKPFHVDELLARAKALIRRASR